MRKSLFFLVCVGALASGEVLASWWGGNLRVSDDFLNASKREVDRGLQQETNRAAREFEKWRQEEEKRKAREAKAEEDRKAREAKEEERRAREREKEAQRAQRKK